MSTAPNSYPSLISSPPLPRTINSPFLITYFKQIPLKNHQVSSFSIKIGNLSSGKQSVLIVKAAGENGEESVTEEEKYEEYEVEIEQPYGLKFAKGRDGGTYIDAIAPGGSADKTKMFEVGDKVIATRYMKCLSRFFSVVYRIYVILMFSVF